MPALFSPFFLTLLAVFLITIWALHRWWAGSPPKLRERHVNNVLVLTVVGTPYHLDQVVQDRVDGGARKIVVNLEEARRLIGIPDTFAACMAVAGEHGAQLRWYCGNNEIRGAVVFGMVLFTHRVATTEREREQLLAETIAATDFRSEIEALGSLAEPD